MQYIILSTDTKQAEYYYRRAKALLNPIIDRVAPYNFEIFIGDTKIRFTSSVYYYTNLRAGNGDAKVMRDVAFEEKLKEYVKTVKDIKEIKK